jgi:hypothetical protein
VESVGLDVHIEPQGRMLVVSWASKKMVDLNALNFPKWSRLPKKVAALDPLFVGDVFPPFETELALEKDYVISHNYYKLLLIGQSTDIWSILYFLICVIHHLRAPKFKRTQK